MFANKKWMKLTALIITVMMSVSMLASCQVGSTIVDEAGNEGVVSVIPKEEQVTVPYTGLPLENTIYTDDPAYAPNTGDNTSNNNTVGDDVPGDDVAGDDVAGDDAPGDDVPGDDAPGDDVAGDDASGDDTADDDFVDDGEYKEENVYSILSYNLRSGNDGGSKDKAARAPYLKQVAESYDADIMGFQEVTPDWCDYTIEFFSEKYDYSYLFRTSAAITPSGAGDEASSIFFKKDKFEMLDTGHFWISDTPEVPSKSWDDNHNRICTWVKLKIKATGKIFYHFNLHTGLTNTCEDKSTKVVLNQLIKIVGEYSATITGDFNMPQWGFGYKNFMSSGDISDVNTDLDNDPTGTVDGYHDYENVTGSKNIIDFCFYTPKGIVPISYKVVDGYTEADNNYVSDHKGLFVEAAVI